MIIIIRFVFGLQYFRKVYFQNCQKTVRTFIHCRGTKITFLFILFTYTCVLKVYFIIQHINVGFAFYFSSLLIFSLIF